MQDTWESADDWFQA
ncbi:hypothetical protein [Yersinia bercovieri]|nr:hypothetical protein [Yersinia bercovieri]